MRQDPETLELLAKCYSSTADFARIVFPGRFKYPFSDEIHTHIFKLTDNRKIQLKAIAAPRGAGKTSIVGLAIPARKILFREVDFLVYVSSTNTHAVQQTENLKYELSTNQTIKKLFGTTKTDNWAKDQWVVRVGGDGDSHEVNVLPRGAGQQIRGNNWRGNRPNLIIVDDLEDPEEVVNEDIRKKQKTWFFADLVNAVNMTDTDWEIIVIGTVLHEASLLEHLLNNKNWASTRLEICDDAYCSKWPSRFTDDHIKKIVSGYRETGDLDIFAREYRNQPISFEDATFSPKLFKSYREGPDFKDRNLINIVIVDPAKSVKMHSDDSAIVGVGIDTRGQVIYVRRVIAGKMYPEELYRNIFSMAAELKAQTVAIEVTSLHEFITAPLKNEMIRTGHIFNLVELNARKSKEDRIKMLAPLYRRGMIYHEEAQCAQLESQLISFPRSTSWDVMDALAYVIQVIDKGDLFFQADNLAMEELAEQEDDEFRELEESYDFEEELVGWRLT